jgi:hypothetical protein
MLVLASAGCALNAESIAKVTATRPPSVGNHCASPPALTNGAGRGFHHASTSLAARLGGPRHRGIDLIAAETDQTQVIGGKLAYSAADKDANHERVELFACVDGDWKSLGDTRTDRGGRFTVTLSGDRRLPVGLRDLYGIVPADRSGFSFLAYVAKAGESVIVTDIDGTITSSENAVFNTVLFGDDIAHRTNAPQALASSGRVVVYLSSRGDQLTGMTRQWLDAHGFPPGPIRHAKSAVTKPGPKTVVFKSEVMKSLGVPIFAAIGNRATDVAAYRAVGVPADRIFMKLPGFDAELAEDLAAKRAIGFVDYASIAARLR